MATEQQIIEELLAENERLRKLCDENAERMSKLTGKNVKLEEENLSLKSQLAYLKRRSLVK